MFRSHIGKAGQNAQEEKLTLAERQWDKGLKIRKKMVDANIYM